MARLLEQRGFFAVRKDGCQELGSCWPSGAVVAPRPQHALVALRGDARQVDVLHGSTMDDALDAGRRAVDCGGADAVRVGRCLGTYGRPALYETALVLARDMADAEAKAAQTWAPGPRTKTPDGAEIKTRSVTISKAAGDTIEGYASTRSVDRDEDIVEPSAFAESLPLYLEKNPIVLFNHDMWRPIGFVVEARIDEKGLWVKCRIVDEEIQKLIGQTVLRTFSVSFIIRDFRFENLNDPDKAETRIITRAELIETSVVSVPSNRDAIFAVAKAWGARNRVSKALAEIEAEAEALCCQVNHPALVGYRRFPMADTSVSWSWDEKAVRSQYGGHVSRLCGTVEHDGSAMLPHHSLVDGELRTVPMGVRLAMAQLISGDISLDAAQRKASWVHLAAHYEEFGAQAPDLPDRSDPGQYAKILGQDQPGIIWSKSKFPTPDDSGSWSRARGFAAADLVEASHTRRFIPKGRAQGEQFPVADGVTLVLTRKDDTMTRKNTEGEPDPKDPATPPADDTATPESDGASPPAGGDQASRPMTTEEMTEAIRAGVVAGIKESQGSPTGDADLQGVEIPVSAETHDLVEFVDRYGVDALSPEMRERLQAGLREDLETAGEPPKE